MKLKTIISLGLWAGLCMGQSLQAQDLNIYSQREPFLIEPFLKAFTDQTGINTKILYSEKGLAQRLKSEGRNSPADVVLTVDIARLSVYDDMGLLSKTASTTLKKIFRLTLDRRKIHGSPCQKDPEFWQHPKIASGQLRSRASKIWRIQNGKDAFVPDPEVTFITAL